MEKNNTVRGLFIQTISLEEYEVSDSTKKALGIDEQNGVSSFLMMC